MDLFRRLISFATTSTLVASALLAMPAAAYAQAPDVAYVSNVSGNVSITRGDSGNAEAAVINAPLMVGDYISTDSGSRAEVTFDSGHMLRVGPSTQLRFSQIDNNADTVQLGQGTVGVGVVRTTSDYTQVETPSAIIKPRELGYYRVDVSPRQVTSITVRSGDAAILLPQGTQYLDPGSTMEVWGPSNDPSWKFIGQNGATSFDQWNQARDDNVYHSAAYQNVPAWMPGAYDLNGSGTWTDDPDYGQVWEPTVAATWTPYSNGRWVWEPYYGWTWVDYDPWGYAPFHYGRWFHHHDRWAWVPGPVLAPVQPWSPALVGFIGFNSGNFSFGLSLIDNVGWVPLAPADPFYPWWGAYGYSGTSINVVYNVVSPVTVYENARWPRAMRWVPRANFANGNYRGFDPVPQRYYSHAAIVRSALPVAPDPHALRYTQNVTNVHVANTESFRSFRTAPHAPATFAQQRQTALSYQDHVRITPTHNAPPATHAAPRTQFAQPRVAAPQQHAQPAPAPRTQFAQPRQAAPQQAVPQHAAPQHAAPQHAAPQQPAQPHTQFAQPRFAPQQHAQPAPVQHAQPAPRPQYAQPQPQHAAPQQRPQPVRQPMFNAPPQQQQHAPQAAPRPQYAAPQRAAPQARPQPVRQQMLPQQHAAPQQQAAPQPRSAPTQHAAPAKDDQTNKDQGK